jgi:hypothetical protein
MGVYAVEGGDEVRRMIDRYQGREMQNALRRAVRAGGKVMQASLKVAAAAEPSGNVPDSFKKVPAPKVSTRGGISGRDIVAKVRPKSPLFNIFEPGAEPHDIAPGKVHREHSVRGKKGRYAGPGAVTRTGPGFLAGPAADSQGSWDPVGRKRGGGFFARRTVHHPGMSSREILPSAFQAGRTAAQLAIAEALFTHTRHR